MNAYIERVLAETKAKNANEPEFLQTVEEVLSSLEPVINAHPEYEKACLLERMVEPERTIEFRVVWMDDNLQYHVNRGYRVQYNAASSTARSARTRAASASRRTFTKASSSSSASSRPSRML